MVMPLRDLNVRHTFPVVTVSFIAINVLAFFYELSLGHRLEDFFLASAFVPDRFFEPGGLASDARSMLVSMFLHGGWAHLFGNMLYLWIFGDNVEDRLGHVRYVVFYLVCGVAATLAHAYSNPSSVVPSIGASGALAGVLGAYLVLFPPARVLTLIPLGFFMRVTELPALAVLGLWFVMQLFSGSLSLGAQTAQTAGVAWWAHIGGFVVGMALGAFFRRRRPPSRVPRSAFSAFLGLLLVSGTAAAQVLIPNQHHRRLTFELHSIRDEITFYIGEPSEFLRLDTRPLGIPPRVDFTPAAQSATLRVRDVALFDTPPAIDEAYIDGELEFEETEESVPNKQEWIIKLFPSGPTEFLLAR